MEPLLRSPRRVIHIAAASLLGLALAASAAGFWAALDLHGAWYAYAVIVVGFLLALLALGLVVVGAHGLVREAEAEYRRRVDDLQRDSLIDPLTGLGSRRSFDEEFNREVARALRHGHTIALALISVDSYDALLEDQGEEAAGEMLVRVAKLLRGRRAEDRSFHLDGGQFALILPYTTAREIYALMEHVRAEAVRSECGSTLTIGIADRVRGWDTVEAVRHRADVSLAEARRRGGNNVVALASRAAPGPRSASA